MKAIRNISLLIIALITISSCTTEEYYTVNDNTYQETWYNKEFTVLEEHWNLVGNPDEPYSYYEYVFDQIQLDKFYTDGVLTAYIYSNYKKTNEKQTPLPYTIYEYYQSNGEDKYFSTLYSYDVKPDGKIIFKAYVSDFFTNPADFNPGTQTFRVTMVY